MIKKHRFYEQYGVEEYYLYDPENWVLEGWRRDGDSLAQIATMDRWRSPRLNVFFDMSQGEAQADRSGWQTFPHL